MQYQVCKWVMPDDLNPHRRLFGGRLLAWADEAGGIFVRQELGSRGVVTRHMSGVNFLASAGENDLVEIGVDIVAVGRTSLTVRVAAWNSETLEELLTIEKMVFVNLDEMGAPRVHNYEKRTDLAVAALPAAPAV